MKWKKTDNGSVFICYGKKYTYAYFKDKDLCKLLVETITIPPARSISYVMRVKDTKTAEQITELLEK